MAKYPAQYSNITRHDRPARPGRGVTSGWQVRIHRQQVEHSKFFSDSVYGSSELSLEAAKEFREGLYKKFGRTSTSGMMPFSDVLPKNNTSGILGVNRSSSRQRNGAIKDYWQTTFPGPNGQVKTKSYAIGKYGEFGALQLAIERRMDGISELLSTPRYSVSFEIIRRQIDRYLDILVYLEGLGVDARKEFERIVSNKKSGPTEKEGLIAARVGQSSFREKVLKYWGGRCAVTGAERLLNASHIKPWAGATNVERLDPFNGLALSPSYDRAFDEGYITFDSAGKIIVEKEFLVDAERIGISSAATLRSVNPFTSEYLRHHFEVIFRDGPNRALKPTKKPLRGFSAA